MGEDATEQQFLEKIKELKKGPSGPACTHTDYGDIKSERDSLKTDNENKKRKISELENEGVITKKVLTEKTNANWEDWGVKISDSQKNLIQSATSAEKVEEIRNEIIKSEFNKLNGEKDSSFYLNIGLGALTIGSLLVLAWMLMKQTNLPEKEPKKEKEK